MSDAEEAHTGERRVFSKWLYLPRLIRRFTQSSPRGLVMIDIFDEARLRPRGSPFDGQKVAVLDAHIP